MAKIMRSDSLDLGPLDRSREPTVFRLRAREIVTTVAENQVVRSSYLDLLLDLGHDGLGNRNLARFIVFRAAYCMVNAKLDGIVCY
ncbi:hypothetical protein A5648_02110 [Mycolicibacter sinensis]|uniref:Uncharacterized protein n=1 Tax=Mycolicibacter sinensis (strain JDM601) TaxID=875328 RepID=A0A1A3U012_MYCSD|nr:hypothetical protein A5648_02110 [Mycolicibacter sinensis]